MNMASKVEIVVITPANFDELRKDKTVMKAARKELDLYGRKVVHSAQMLAPVDQGAFRNGIDYSLNNEGQLKLVWKKPASRPRQLIDWILYGTGKHGPRNAFIVPKRKGGVMRWRDKFGGWHSAKKTRGMKPRNFVQDAWDNTETDRRKLARRVGRLIVDAMTSGRGKTGTVVPTRK
jgi:hypothetical protein